MSLLRVELDIDGDVYPELHAALLSIAGDASRAERLRQLAASGLVWEKIRVHGPTVVHGALPATAAAPAPAPRKAAPSPPKPRTRVAEPPPVLPPGDFVDLALDAAPPPPPPQPPRAPPVLMDIVDPEDVRSAPPMPLRRAASTPASAPASTPANAPDVAQPAAATPRPPAPATPPAALLRQPAAVVLPPPVAQLPQLIEELAPRVEAASEESFKPPFEPTLETPFDAAPEPPAEPVLEHRSSTRSRLQRMKERGLFKNG